MKVKLEVYKDAFISQGKPWRAKVSCEDGSKFTTGMYRSKKSIVEVFNGHQVSVVRRTDLDCR